jgi:hypothetical protein
MIATLSSLAGGSARNAVPLHGPSATADALNGLYWYDGTLDHLAFQMDERGASFRITAHLFKDDRSRQRQVCQIHCDRVSRFSTTLKTAEMRENAQIGNIAYGCLKGSTLWVHLTEGLLEIDAAAFHIVQTGTPG